MSNITLRLPESLHNRLRELASREGVSMNQFVTLALAEKLSVLEARDYLTQRTGKGDRAKFDRAVGKVAETDPPEYDR